MLLYSRKKVRYRRDGYCWKKRKDGKTTREDHMKLKVQGIECIYGCYVHSAILPTFHRRCYWLLQNPDIVLVHYLNVPYPDDNKLVMASSISLWADKKEWTKEELVSQLKPMFFSEDEPDLNNELEISTAETVEAIVAQLMEKQRVARAAASNKGVDCGCGGSGSPCGDHSKACPHHPLRRISVATKLHHDSTNTVSSSRQALVAALPAPSDADTNNQVSSTSGPSGNLPPRYQGLTQEGSRAPEPPHTTTTSSSSTSSSSSSSTTSSNTKNNNNNNNNTTSAPLILNLSNIQGGGGLLILNSAGGPPGGSGPHGPHLTAAPLTLTSYLGQPPGTTGASSIAAGHLQVTHCPPPPTQAHVVHQGPSPVVHHTSHQGPPQHHHHHHHHHQHHHPAHGPNPHHHLQHQQQQQQQQQQKQQQQQHANHQQQTNSAQHHSQASHIQTSLLVKREVASAAAAAAAAAAATAAAAAAATANSGGEVASKADVIESLKLDATNGNLTLDSGTFANLVSSLEAGEPHQNQPTKDTFLGIKAELSDLSVERNELFTDTLDLSPDDIQKTLSANMPPGSCHRKTPSNSDVNPMDFIDNDITSPEDDVLVNLDAFDMLGDFPDLDHYETSPAGNMNSNNSNSSTSTNNSGKSVTTQSQQTMRMEYRENTANITDYSPEWAYPEGGVKVLVTGPWYSSSSPYTVLFDGVPTPTTLVQSGVLRCYCPAHEVGLVTLQVACEGFVISNSVIFEYKKPPSDENKVKELVRWFSSSQEQIVREQDEHLLKFTLLQRLETMETRVDVQNDNQENKYDNDVMMHKAANFEERVILYCQKMSAKPWLAMDQGFASGLPDLHGLTLLHLASMLGYSRLIMCLLKWREENPSLVLECEVDALRQDSRGCTALTWACSRGHRDTALLLYRWNRQALLAKNQLGQTPLECAQINGHFKLHDELEQIQKEHNDDVLDSLSHVKLPSPPTPFSPLGPFSPATTASHSPSVSSLSLQTSASSSSTTPTSCVGPCSTPIPTITGSGIPKISSEGSLSNPTDVFLRPSPRRCDLRKQRHLSVDLPLSSDERIGTTGTCGPDMGPGPAALGCPSPAPSTSSTSSGRSRLIKRPSVDSGINLAQVDTYKRASLDSGLDVLQKYSRSSGTSPQVSSHTLMVDTATEDVDSPMTLDLTPGAAGDVQDPQDSTPSSGLDSSYASRRESLSSEMASLNGADDTRVFTLAEQIIAALPERIKSDREDLMHLELMSPVVVEPPSSELDMEVILDDPPDNSHEFHFEFSDITSYRYYDVGTPSSSMSPTSSSCLPSPASFTLESPSPPPTTADFSEFFQASTKDFSKDFSNLTLSDREQRELYEAAKIIQKAFRLYKGRKRLQAEQDKERQAAVVIQNYYRRYKQYVYFRQMSRAATLIQNQFRSYCEHKRFKKSQEGGSLSSVSTFRGSRETTPVPTLKRTYSQRRQHQAARKIQQFMRQTKQKENGHWQPKERSWHKQWGGRGEQLQFHWGGQQQQQQQQQQCQQQQQQQQWGGRDWDHQPGVTSSSQQRWGSSHWGPPSPTAATLYSPAQPLQLRRVKMENLSKLLSHGCFKWKVEYHRTLITSSPKLCGVELPRAL
ncbi:calmodulin-binding transcription activator isoform X6 [Oratosquilla oratoria]|uniref:calmodulin-binding transcription activator isoform X6 n=1 Tax=Oratosquilla oratoria TaxID=337810 RepID=UPI003F766C6E